MPSSRLSRLAPLTGALFAVIFYIAIFASGETPDADAGPAEAVRFWSDHDSAQIAFSIAAVVAMVLFVWFAGTLRSRLLESEGGEGRLTTTAYAGALLFTAGLLVNVGITFTAADTAGDLAPAATQTLNALSSDMFFPMVGGAAILYLATAASVLRFAALPKWLGWVSLVLGVVSFTPAGFVSFLALGLWVVAISVILYRAGAGATSPAGETTGTMPAAAT